MSYFRFFHVSWMNERQGKRVTVLALLINLLHSNYFSVLISANSHNDNIN